MEAWTKCGLIPFDGTAATGGISSTGSGTNARWFGLESGVGALGRGIGMGADCGHPVRALTLIASSSWSLPVYGKCKSVDVAKVAPFSRLECARSLIISPSTELQSVLLRGSESSWDLVSEFSNWLLCVSLCLSQPVQKGTSVDVSISKTSSSRSRSWSSTSVRSIPASRESDSVKLPSWNSAPENPVALPEVAPEVDGLGLDVHGEDVDGAGEET